ncbi:MAG: response regulator [Rhodospirillaceae bacterium]|nr:response regulator [Rhodospirillaceae bacterium]
MKTANKILIVDDDRDILDYLIDILQDEVSVSFAPSGIKALELTKTHRPDLILLDVDMPEMDGFEVCRRLKKNTDTQHIPVIFLTGMSNEKDVTEGLQLGAVDYITKPFDSKIVIAKVNNHLSQITAMRASQKTPPVPEPDPSGGQSVLSGGPHQPAAAAQGKSRGLLIMAAALVVLLLIGGGAFLNFRNNAEVISETPSTETAGSNWPFSSKCKEAPIVSWWGTTTHFSMVDYVDRKHNGNWAPYLDKWINQLNKMQSIYDREGTAKASDGTVLSQDKLLTHIEKLNDRISVIKCLAAESRTLK